ncbi:MAG: hypothetical protein V1917_00775 [Candidatus Gottesmanbacteria bacterium]
MKQHDVTKKVMEKVVHFEENRSAGWMEKYWIALVFLFIGLIYASITIYKEYRFFDEDFMVSWYFEDWELFRVVWKDALAFIWSFVPVYWVYGLGIGIITVIGIVVGTYAKRKKITRILQSIKMYKK